VSIGAPSPFGRGANAPLAGRTILQIVPPIAAGGDERATLAITAALAETGARPLVATDSSELAGELQAIGGLFVRFPAATKNPIAMAHHSCGTGRPRACALSLGCLGCGQGLPQGETATHHLASGRRRRGPSAHQLRNRGRRGRHRHRLFGIRRWARGRPLSRHPHPAQDRPPRDGSREASAGTGERTPCSRGSFKLGRRGA
jgi:hypothetical protein